MLNKIDSKNKKIIYQFYQGFAEGTSGMENIIGNKGSGLAMMSKLGLPVPPGFTISSQVNQIYDLTRDITPVHFRKQIRSAMLSLGKKLDLGFGNHDKPLLISVRSGAGVSMPGMMETVLNLGINKDTVNGLSKMTGSKTFAYDCYRRFIEMYSHVVLGMSKNLFMRVYQTYERLDPLDKHEKIVDKYLELVFHHTGRQFPQNVWDQLNNTIIAIFNSWYTNRAIKYREMYSIDDKIHTAVNIQSMVFGNKCKNSAAGVIFTRNPSNGEAMLFGEFLTNAQGEDIVSGSTTPMPINIYTQRYQGSKAEPLESLMPDLYLKLKKISTQLETYYGDMQDIEFTIDAGMLWILQTRSGKRTADATIKIALDFYKKELINQKELISRINISILEKVLHNNIDPNATKKPLAKGFAASPGATSGIVVFSCRQAGSISSQHDVILVRKETSPDDINGMEISSGILTVRGGMTSHAAVIARGMGKPCITGASDVMINDLCTEMLINGVLIKEGDYITIDGFTGSIFKGKMNTVQAKVTKHLTDFIQIIDQEQTISIRANAETQQDLLLAQKFKVQGIGLCRTEHMFFSRDRIDIFRKLILSFDHIEKTRSISLLKSFQEQDFYNLFHVMKDSSMTIRLLDPPLHEFFPRSSNTKEILSLSKSFMLSVDEIKKRISVMMETNPMLGFRGARLGLLNPDIYTAQVQAIFSAACRVKKENINVIPEIMVPLVMNLQEFLYLKSLIVKTAEKIFIARKIRIPFLIGTMVELPSTVMNISQIVPHVDFLSFGTNDLTQTCLGISRDDSNTFLKKYIDLGIFNTNPFITLETSVKKMISMAILQARRVKPEIKIGACGEHAGDPESIQFFISQKIDYISCSPLRIPIAKIIANRYYGK